jgi:repressor LexA
MRKPGLSDTRERILKYIHEYVDDKGYAPTVRDILKGLDLSSTSVVQHHLNILEREGHIRRDQQVFRSIQLSDKKNIIAVPVLGVIAAGAPIPVPTSDTWRNEAVESIELTDDITGGKEVFALRVKGLSMIDALIDDGDIVLLEPASSADDGDMVAAWLKNEQEATLKRIFYEPNRVRLQPANRDMKPIYVKPDNLEVQGKVLGVIRKF